MGSRPVRSPRSDKGKTQITDRDITVLTWVGEQYAVRLDSLQQLLGREAVQETVIPGLVGEPGAHRVVKRWEQEGLVASRKFFYRKPHWVWLTSKGLSQMNLDFKTREPKVSMLNHYHDVNEVRLLFETQLGTAAVWHCERAMRKEHQGDKVFHIPDGEIHYQDAVYAVEVELTQKSTKRTAGIVRKLAAQYDGIWYFVNDITRRTVEPVVTQVMGEQAANVKYHDISKIRRSTTP